MNITENFAISSLFILLELSILFILLNDLFWVILIMILFSALHLLHCSTFLCEFFPPIHTDLVKFWQHSKLLLYLVNKLLMQTIFWAI